MDGPGGGAAFAAAGAVVADDVRDLVDVPVFVEVALADGVVDVVGEEFGVLEVEAPVPVVVALEELGGGAVGDADLPELLAVADGLPVELAEVERLARDYGDVGLGVLAEDAVGDGVKLVGAGADLGDGEVAVG